MDRHFLSAARSLTHKHERIPAAWRGPSPSTQERNARRVKQRERERGRWRARDWDFPQDLRKKKGGREEADSGSDGRQEQIQEEGKWMGCLVYGLDSVSHSGNDPVITEHCVKKKGPYSMIHKKIVL